MKGFRRLAVSMIVALAAGPAIGYGQAAKQGSDAAAKPNFSGRWHMLKDKSDFATFRPPDIVIQVVEHRDPTMNVHTVETTGKNTTTADVSYFTDGTISKNVVSGREAESKAFWDGPALNVRTTEKNSKGEDVVIEDRWELSEDGETLTRTSHIATAQGSVDMKLVAQKQKTGS